MNKLSESQRRLLTEMIGECWHECDYSNQRCDYCGLSTYSWKRRTFTTWPDLGLVKEAIERAGKWGEFFEYANGIWWPQSGTKTTDADRAGWLFTPSRFCILAAEWAESLNEENKFWRK